MKKESILKTYNFENAFSFRYYEFDTAYCVGNDSDYESSDMSTYMDIRKWGKLLDEMKTGKLLLFLLDFII
jgi:hypothetical protein